MRPFAGLLASLLFLGLAANSAAGPLSERVLFVSEPQGIPKIYSVRPDGLDARRLTGRRKGPEREPEFHAPSGRVVFRSQADGNDDIYLVDAYGRQEQRLTTHEERDIQPSWNPEGNKVVFSTERWGAFELAVMDLETKSIERLTYDQAGSLEPRWSPDGSQIVFVSHRHGNATLYLFRLQDKSFKRLTFDPRAAVAPRWSPSGDRVVYQSQKGGRRRPSLRVYVLADENDYEVAEEAVDPQHPSWSPDGQMLLFAAGHPQSRSLFRYELDAGVLTPFALRGNLPPAESHWSTVPLPWSNPPRLETLLEDPAPKE